MPKKHPSPSGEVVRTRRRARGQHAKRTHAEDGEIIFFTQAEVRALLTATKQQKKLRDQGTVHIRAEMGGKGQHPCRNDRFCKSEFPQKLR